MTTEGPTTPGPKPRTPNAPGPKRTARPEKERTLPINRAVFSRRLWQAIKRSGLTYREAARRAKAHLPPGERLSDVSVWSYAKGRSLPSRIAPIEALAKVLGLAYSDLVEEVDAMRAPPASEPVGMTVEDLGDGRARIVANVEAPWPIALEVLRLLRGEPQATSPSPEPAAADAPSPAADRA